MEKEEIYTLEITGSYISKREQPREIPDFICKVNLKKYFHYDVEVFDEADYSFFESVAHVI